PGRSPLPGHGQYPPGLYGCAPDEHGVTRGASAVGRMQPATVVEPSGRRTVGLGLATTAARSSLAELRTVARTRRPGLGDARGGAPRVAQPLRGGAPAKPGDSRSSARVAGLSGATRALAWRTGWAARGVTAMKE